MMQEQEIKRAVREKLETKIGKGTFGNALLHVLIALVVMVVVSVLGLIIVSTLTYAFKWKAPQAMLGITLLYIVIGVAGGFLHGSLSGQQVLKERVICGVLMGTGYMGLFLVVALSVAGVIEASLEWSRFWTVWLLVACSACLGEVISNRFCKKR